VTEPATFDRAANLARLADEPFDVLVVGGGITGAGVALDAAVRGLRVAMVERDDFASGTSSKSSKLVHGGLRYLQQREFRLVYEALHERQRLLRNAPHLVRVLPFLIPLFGRGTANKALARLYSTVLWQYDLTGGARLGKLHERISIEQAQAHMPTLDTTKLGAAFLYYDAQADDARLTLTIARTAADHGAAVVNHCGVTALTKSGNGRVDGAVLADGTTVRASAVVNAAGVWSDDVRSLAEGSHLQSIRPAKGVHLTVPWDKVRCDIAAVLPVRKDRRSIFVVPWGDRVYIGTTDTDYDGPLDDPLCTPEDVEYVLGAINDVIDSPLKPTDVLGTWAGLRPLVKDASSARTADLSRRHRVGVDDVGLVTVTGGKLTTYRKMAEDTVDAVEHALGRKRRFANRSHTERLRLHGAEGFDRTKLDHLTGRFGSDASAVTALIDRDPSLGQPLVPTLPYLRAEAVHAVRHEMATTLDDVLSRRTRARLLARDASARAAADVAALIAPALGWSAEDAAHQAEDFRSRAVAEREAAGLPETALDASIGA
jgi:glycerol-3-phosphate dehydrogenase